MIAPDNADPEEIEKFNRLAADWWDTEGTSAALHAINPLRLSFIQTYTNLKDRSVLDVGCGGGILTESLAIAGAQTTGLDLATASLECARRHSENNSLSINYIKSTVETYAEDNPTRFDVITCMELLEHVPDPQSIIQACSKLAKPGAHIFFSTINRNVKSYFSAIVGAEYVLKLLPKQTHDYAKFIKPSELAQWCRNAGISWQHTIGITYNPFTQQYSTTPSTDVNYIVHCIRD